MEKKEKLKCLKREHEELEVKHARLKQKYEGCFLGQKYTSKYFLKTYHGGKKHIDPPSFILLLFGEQKHLVIFFPLALRPKFEIDRFFLHYLIILSEQL